MTFIELLQDIRDGKYPEIVLMHEEVVALEVLIQAAKTETVAAQDIVVPLAAQVELDFASVSESKDVVVAAEQNVTSLELSVEQKHAQIIGLAAAANTLLAGSAASASYNPVTGVMTIGVPQGDKGDRGDAFQVSAQGLFADRVNYDLQPAGFSYFAEDVGLIYFKNSETSGDWGTGIPFGKGDTGDQGESINMQVGVGNIIQWQYPSEGAVWHDLVDLDAVYDGTYLTVGGKAADSALLNGKSVVDSLTSTDTLAPLSAAQGKALFESKLESTNYASDSVGGVIKVGNHLSISSGVLSTNGLWEMLGLLGYDCTVDFDASMILYGVDELFIRGSLTVTITGADPKVYCGVPDGYSWCEVASITLNGLAFDTSWVNTSTNNFFFEFTGSGTATIDFIARVYV